MDALVSPLGLEPRLGRVRTACINRYARGRLTIYFKRSRLTRTILADGLAFLMTVLEGVRLVDAGIENSLEVIGASYRTRTDTVCLEGRHASH